MKLLRGFGVVISTLSIFFFGFLTYQLYAVYHGFYISYNDSKILTELIIHLLLLSNVLLIIAYIIDWKKINDWIGIIDLDDHDLIDIKEDRSSDKAFMNIWIFSFRMLLSIIPFGLFVLLIVVLVERVVLVEGGFPDLTTEDMLALTAIILMTLSNLIPVFYHLKLFKTKKTLDRDR